MRTLFFALSLSAASLLALLAPSAFAATGNTPYTMNFTGTLGVNSGTLNTTYEMRFLVSVNGSPIWCGEYDTVSVSTTGIFSVVLGENDSQGGQGLTVATDPSSCSSPGSQAIAISPSLLTGVTESTPVTLLVAVNNGVTWETLSPSDPLPISSALFALQADTALTASTATAASGLLSGSTDIPMSSTAPTSGQILEYNGSEWTPSSAGSGTPGNPANSVQFNSSGSFAGSADLTWDNTNFRLGVGGPITPLTQLDVSGLNTNGTFRVFDQTSSTGDTREIIRAGANQGTTNLTEWQNNASGTVMASVSSTGGMTTPSLDLSGSTSGNIILKAPATGGAATYTLPSTATNGDFLTTDGSGNLSWAAVSAGSGTVDTGTAGQMAYYPASSAEVSGNPDATISSGALTLGTSSVLGDLVLEGSNSSAVTMLPSTTTGSYNFNLPTTAGTSGQPLLSGGGGSTAMTFGTLQVGGGGTGLMSTTANEILYSSATNTIGQIATADGGVLNTDSSGVPSITTAPVLGVNGATSGTIGLANGTTSGATTTIAPSSSTTTAWQMTLPSSGGTSGYVLQTDGSGNTSWVAASSGSGTVSSGTTNELAYYTGATTVSSTADASISSGALTLGTSSVLGDLVLDGSNGSAVTMLPSTTTGSYNFNLPTTAGTSGQPLLSGGGGSTAMTFGTLQVGGGGTGDMTLSAHGVLVGEGTSNVSAATAAASGTILQGSASADPTFTAAPVLGVNGATSGTIGLANATTSGATTTIAPSSSTMTAWQMTLPSDGGSNGQVLQTDGSGNTSWVTLSSGSGTVSNGDTDQIAYYSTTGSTVSGNPDATISSGALTLGTSSVLGDLVLEGSNSSAVTMLPSTTTGSYNFNLPTTAGTSGQPLLSGGGGSTAMTFGTLQVGGGGTGLMSTTANEILYSSATNTIGQIATADGGVLNTDSSGVPSITTAPVLGVNGATSGTIGLANGTTSGATTTIAPSSSTTTAWQMTLPSSGGTSGYVLQTDGSGNTSWVAASSGSGTVSSGTTNELAYYTGATTVSSTADASISSGALTLGTSSVLGDLVLDGSNGSAVTMLPSTTTGSYNFNLPTTAGTSGQPLLSGGGGSTAMTFGTLQVGGGGTGLTSTTANEILYSSATNTIGQIATADGGVLNTDSSGVPSITAAPVLGVNGATSGTIGLANGTTSGATTTIAPSTTTTTEWTLTLPSSGGTSGYVLQTDGSGNTSWVQGGSGAVSSGTTNELAYYTGSTTVGSTADASISSGALTLGTSSVLGDLVLDGSNGSAVTMLPSTTTGSYNFNLPTAAGTSGQPLLSGGGGSTAMTFGTLGVGAGGTGDMTLSAHGVLVGEGTSNVSAATAAASGTILQGSASADPTFTAAPVLGVNGTTSGTIGLANATTSGATTTIAPSSSTTTAWQMTLPSSGGSSGYVLQTDGSGNTSWVQGGSGTVSSGTTNELAYYTGATTVGSAAAASISSGALTLGTSTSVRGTIGLYNGGSSGGMTTIESSPSFFSSSSWTMTLPSSAGTSGYALETDGSGNTSWAQVAGLASSGTANAIPKFASTSTLENSSISDSGTAISTTEAVGVGMSPETGAELDVAGQIHAQVYNNGSSTTIDWANGNVQTTSASCNGSATQFSFSDMLEGGSYTLIVTGSSSGECNFTTSGGTTVSPSGVTGWTFQPSNTATTASTSTVYTMLRANNVIYVSWITGFGTPN